MDVEQLKEDVRSGRITVDRLIDLVVTLQRELQAAKQELDMRARLDERQQGGAPTAKVSEPFSVRGGRTAAGGAGKEAAEAKAAVAGRADDALRKRSPRPCGPRRSFPAGVPEADCRLSHTRPVWRLENGRAVLVAYEIYRGPKNQYGKIPGVFGRSEFGAEIVLAIAYQVYIVGLSFDKVCLLMNFFQNLKLRKSQADALLNQLARQWEEEFDLLCMLLANSLVVHTDETGWSINSVWAFLSEKVRVLFFGVHKDAETLRQILDPATFAGIVISDDAAVYANFTQSQKCWAHLLRKAIKLTLDGAGQRRVSPVHRSAAGDLPRSLSGAARPATERGGPEGRRSRCWTTRFLICAVPMWVAELPPGEGPEDDYRRLCNELMRVMLAEQLFTFVTAEPVEKPNGETLVGVGNEQRSRTNAPLSGTGPGHGPHQQDGGWRTASNGHRERVGIAPSTPFHLYAIERNRGNPALVRDRPQLFRPMGGETWVDSTTGFPMTAASRCWTA